MRVFSVAHIHSLIHVNSQAIVSFLNTSTNHRENFLTLHKAVKKTGVMMGVKFNFSSNLFAGITNHSFDSV